MFLSTETSLYSAARKGKKKQQMHYHPDPGRKLPETLYLRGEMAARTLHRDPPGDGGVQESTPRGRERGPPAIPDDSRIDTKSKNDQ